MGACFSRAREEADQEARRSLQRVVKAASSDVSCSDPGRPSVPLSAKLNGGGGGLDENISVPRKKLSRGNLTSGHLTRPPTPWTASLPDPGPEADFAEGNLTSISPDTSELAAAFATRVAKGAAATTSVSPVTYLNFNIDHAAAATALGAAGGTASRRNVLDRDSVVVDSMSSDTSLISSDVFQSCHSGPAVLSSPAMTWDGSGPGSSPRTSRGRSPHRSMWRAGLDGTRPARLGRAQTPGPGRPRCGARQTGGDGDRVEEVVLDDEGDGVDDEGADDAEGSKGTTVEAEAAASPRRSGSTISRQGLGGGQFELSAGSGDGGGGEGEGSISRASSRQVSLASASRSELSTPSQQRSPLHSWRALKQTLSKRWMQNPQREGAAAGKEQQEGSTHGSAHEGQREDAADDDEAAALRSLQRRATLSAAAAAAAAAVAAEMEKKEREAAGDDSAAGRDSGSSPRWASRLSPAESQSSLSQRASNAAAAAAGGSGDFSGLRSRRLGSGSNGGGQSSGRYAPPDQYEHGGHPSPYQLDVAPAAAAAAAAGLGVLAQRSSAPSQRQSLQLLRRATANRVKAAAGTAGSPRGFTPLTSFTAAPGDGGGGVSREPNDSELPYGRAQGGGEGVPGSGVAGDGEARVEAFDTSEPLCGEMALEELRSEEAVVMWAAAERAVPGGVSGSAVGSPSLRNGEYSGSGSGSGCGGGGLAGGEAETGASRSRAASALQRLRSQAAARYSMATTGSDRVRLEYVPACPSFRRQRATEVPLLQSLSRARFGAVVVPDTAGAAAMTTATTRMGCDTLGVSAGRGAPTRMSSSGSLRSSTRQLHQTSFGDTPPAQAEPPPSLSPPTALRVAACPRVKAFSEMGASPYGTSPSQTAPGDLSGGGGVAAATAGRRPKTPYPRGARQSSAEEADAPQQPQSLHGRLQSGLKPQPAQATQRAAPTLSQTLSLGRQARRYFQEGQSGDLPRQFGRGGNPRYASHDGVSSEELELRPTVLLEPRRTTISSALDSGQELAREKPLWLYPTARSAKNLGLRAAAPSAESLLGPAGTTAPPEYLRPAAPLPPPPLPSPPPPSPAPPPLMAIRTVFWSDAITSGGAPAASQVAWGSPRGEAHDGVNYAYGNATAASPHNPQHCPPYAKCSPRLQPQQPWPQVGVYGAPDWSELPYDGAAPGSVDCGSECTLPGDKRAGSGGTGGLGGYGGTRAASGPGMSPLGYRHPTRPLRLSDPYDRTVGEPLPQGAPPPLAPPGLTTYESDEDSGDFGRPFLAAARSNGAPMVDQARPFAEDIPGGRYPASGQNSGSSSGVGADSRRGGMYPASYASVHPRNPDSPCYGGHGPDSPRYQLRAPDSPRQLARA